MTKEKFWALNHGERLEEIYRVLPKPTAPGESPIAGLFGPGREDPDREIVNPKNPDPDFINIFGKYPTREMGGGARFLWKKDLERWEGSIDLSLDSEYIFKATESMNEGLGLPLAYKFNGDEYVTFSGFKGHRWRRSLVDYYETWKTLLIIAVHINRTI